MEVAEAYRFCPRCGGRFKKASDFLNCPSCDLKFYINPKACNGIVLTNGQGEIMLVERAYEPGRGLWDVPGGFVDSGESFEESMHRELKEELGIEVNNLEYVGSIIDTYNFQGVVYPTVGTMFAATLNGDEKIKIADDVASYKFFNPAELPFKDFAFPWMEKFFKNYS